MVDSLFFRATLTGRRGGHSTFVQAGVEASNTSEEAVKPDPGSFREGHPGVLDAGVSDENEESSKIVRSLRIPLMTHRVDEVGMSTAAPNRSTVLCG